MAEAPNVPLLCKSVNLKSPASTKSKLDNCTDFIDSYVLKTDLSCGQVIHAFIDHIYKDRYSMLIGQKRRLARQELCACAGALIHVIV